MGNNEFDLEKHEFYLKYDAFYLENFILIWNDGFYLDKNESDLESDELFLEKGKFD